MSNWKINDVDIHERFGVLLKRGAYDEIFRTAPTKSYLTEDVREIEGERVVFFNPRSKARDVSIPIFIEADDMADFFRKYDDFCRFLKEQPIKLELCRHNRIYTYYFKQCNSMTNHTKYHDDKIVVECVLLLREVNPNNILTRVYLAQENEEYILTEDGYKIEILTNVG